MPFTLDYRPNSFVTTTGQEHIKTVLQQQISTGTAKSNYLFFGPRGTGKTTTARVMAKALNCLDLQEGNPCNTCEHCSIIDQGKTLDFVEIDAASHTGVDNIREEIIDKALYPPTRLRKKVYIIDEVHMLSKGAFNALLKIMEEPPTYMTFILATTEIHKIPDTIISRCQTFPFRHLTQEQLVSRLSFIAQQENIVADDAALLLIARTAEGIMRDAIKYLEQVSVLGDITVEQVRHYLGVVGDEQLVQLLSLIEGQDFSGSIAFIQELYESGVDLSVYVKQMMEYIDQHFLDNPEQMAVHAETFSTISSKMRQVPHALLAYKLSIYTAIHGHSLSHRSSQQTPSPTYPQTRATTSSTTPPAVTVTSKPAPSSKDIKKDKESPAVATSTAPATTSTASISPEQLKEKLTSKLEISARSLVEKYVVVEKITDNEVSLIAINKMAELSLLKNPALLEKQISAILGSDHRVSLRFMSKEDYFASL